MPLFALGHHREEGSGQVIVGGDLEEVDPGSDAGGGNSLFSIRRGFGESLSELGICGVDGHLFAGLGVLYDDATLGFNELLDGVVPQHCADAVSPMAEKTGEGRDEFVGDLFLGATAMAELHRQCAVEKEPGCEISVFVVLANKWSVHPRGDVPVDAAYIIIGLIFAKIRDI